MGPQAGKVGEDRGTFTEHLLCPGTSSCLLRLPGVIVLGFQKEKPLESFRNSPQVTQLEEAGQSEGSSLCFLPNTTLSVGLPEKSFVNYVSSPISQEFGFISILNQKITFSQDAKLLIDALLREGLR